MKLAIIGGGPAGLRAAEVAAEKGASVTVFDAKPSMGRKFLVAGSGGLNLTRAETPQRLASRYKGGDMPEEMWPSLIADFDAKAMRAWAEGLGVQTFAASTGRVYPLGLKSAPLLRRWLARLRELHVDFRPRHRWVGFTPCDGKPHPRQFRLDFAVGPLGEPAAFAPFTADAVILALGGGSWPETGSDGAWMERFTTMGVGLAPLEPANCGWEIPWSEAILEHAEGHPLKNIVAKAGSVESPGELVITHYGLEGSALYALGPALREMKRRQATAELRLDLKPDLTVEKLVTKLGTLGKNSSGYLAEARLRWKLSTAAHALLSSRGPYATPAALAAETKNFRLFLTGPRPLEEAISSAGGVQWSELDGGLMLRRHPGVFLAGEMIDWEAPTGGYLLQGCFATATRAARQALEWMRAE